MPRANAGPSPPGTASAYLRDRPSMSGLPSVPYPYSSNAYIMQSVASETAGRSKTLVPLSAAHSMPLPDRNLTVLAASSLVLTITAMSRYERARAPPFPANSAPRRPSIVSQTKPNSSVSVPKCWWTMSPRSKAPARPGCASMAFGTRFLLPAMSLAAAPTRAPVAR